MSPAKYLAPLLETYTQHADATDARGMAAYLKNQFTCYGIKTDLRRKLLKQFLSEHPLPQQPGYEALASYLYSRPERECHYTAIELLAAGKNYNSKDITGLLEKMITTHSWWDSVDPIATTLVAAHFLKYPDRIIPVTSRWMASDNIWLQRTCLLFQLPYKTKTDTTLLFKYCTQLSQSNEFFIQKAIGWALRQYARTNSKAVASFAATANLKPLSKREALKHIRQ